jgi:hypothetical protein
MPFDVREATHAFTKTPTGGVQRVVAKSADNTPQIEMIRAHLTRRFLRAGSRAWRRYAGACGIASGKGWRTKTRYHDIRSGAEAEYFSDNPKIITAVHDWFDAQLADHGADAVLGHDHSMSHDE